ncbi:uncharacterized protein KIAA2012 homolog [Petaurus breviceps papuanus]|uniref:uncharacterized protein KIAA2012 homolog n=1 Tax=Petaurus breviceps papuanus TaxID=3040969 RepID=UPI0036DB8C93
MFTLSLLSRGNGQVVQSKQKRLEVYLEPEDYLNWIPQDKALIDKSQDGAKVPWGSLPKTYSTRKGVLILYSEDFAEPSWKQEERKKGSRPNCRQKKTGFAMHTLKDLTDAILAYGSEGKDQKDPGWQPYLHFLNKPNNLGYSAKKYLFSLFQNWIPGALYKLQNSGYIRDPRLFQDNQLYLPNHIRRQQDLSAVPSKYHLLPVYPSVSTFWTQKEQLADEDESDLNYEESGDSHVGKEDFKAEKQWKEKAPLPPLRQKPPRKAAWLEDEAYTEDAWMVAHQGTQALKRSQGHCGKSHPPLGSDSVFTKYETSQLPSQRSHNMFYGGTFLDRTTYFSGNVKISKSRHQMFPELPAGKCTLPPVQTTINPEQNVPRKVKKKKVPNALKLPAITEKTARSQEPPRTELNDYGIPEELLILPLEVHLSAEHQPKEKGQREESWNTEVKPKANVYEKYLPRLSLKHPCYSQLPLTVHLPRASGNDFFHPHTSTHGIRDSETKSSKIQQKTSGARSPKDIMDDGTNQSDLPEEFIGSSQDPALGNILMEPAGDTVYQPLLGSVQSMDLPLQFDFASGEAYQFVDPSTNLSEACSSNQHVKKGNIHSEAHLHVNTWETSSLTPEPAEKGAPQSLEAAVLKTGESQSFINKELENEKEQGHQRMQSRTIPENHQHDPGKGEHELKVRLQTEEPCSGADVSPEHQRPAQDGYAPSVLETEKSKPQADRSSTKEIEKQRDGSSGSLGSSGLERNLTPLAETIQELGGDNELLHHLTRPPGNAPVAPKMVEIKKNPTEKQLLSRSRKGKDVLPKFGKLAAKSISPERQMPEKTKRRKIKEVNKSKAPPNVGKREKPQNKSEVVGGKPKKQKIENKTTSVSKKKKPIAKKKEMGQKGSVLEIGSELGNSSSTEDEFGEECSLSSYSSQECMLPPKYQTPESQVSRDERLYPIQARTVKENADSEKDKSADTSEVRMDGLSFFTVVVCAFSVDSTPWAWHTVGRYLTSFHSAGAFYSLSLHFLRPGFLSLQKQRLEEERQQQEEEERRRLQQEQAAQARAKQQQEEFRRKMQEMQRKKQEEEARRAEAEKQRQKELERQLEQEQKRLMEMAKEERLEYQRRKEEEEEKARRDAEAKEQREEERARLALEKAMEKAKKLEREKEALEAQQRFHQELLKEANELKHIQSISRPWVYSYFQMLPVLGSGAVTKDK